MVIWYNWSMENFGKIVVRNQLSGEEKKSVSNLINNVKNQDLELLKSKQEEIDISEYFETDFFLKVNDINKKVFDIMKDRGIVGLENVPIFINKSVNEIGGDSDTIGYYRQGVDNIVMNLDKLLQLEDPEIREIEALTTLAHEMYHSTMKVSYDIKDGSLNPASTGAGYAKKDEYYGDALEEGLALDMQMIIKREILNEMTDPDVQERYQEIVNNNNSEDAQRMQKEGIPLDMLHILTIDIDGNSEVAFNKDYLYSYKLIKYLRENIVSFDVIIEKSRCERKPLDFARAVESTFGEGSYREITTASTQDAESMIEKLKDRLSKLK